MSSTTDAPCSTTGAPPHDSASDVPPEDRSPKAGRVAPRGSVVRLLGPAFVAAIAYVDPGNIAANMSAGARYGYLLLWVLVVANAMAVLVQYLSAKLGAVTGHSLAEVLGERLGRRARLVYWAQAELVAAATDVAEVIGGAIALQILFGMPLVPGGILVGVVSMLLLTVQSRRGQRAFEHVVIAFLALITVGFLSGLVLDPPDLAALADGLLPRFHGTDTVLLAASMLGATVMPHAIYLHSGLVRDRHGGGGSPARIRRLLRATRWDVVLSLLVAGSVNIAMLVLAAEALPGVPGTDTIEGAHHAISQASGPVVASLFGVGLLASGLASTSVGAYAGAQIMEGLLHVRIPLLIRRAVTLVPALALLAIGTEPTWTLVLSQVVLSIGIPFALVPLMVLTSRRALMGDFANGRPMRLAATIVALAIIALNVALVVFTALGLG